MIPVVTNDLRKTVKASEKCWTILKKLKNFCGKFQKNFQCFTPIFQSRIFLSSSIFRPEFFTSIFWDSRPFARSHLPKNTFTRMIYTENCWPNAFHPNAIITEKHNKFISKCKDDFGQKFSGKKVLGDIIWAKEFSADSLVWIARNNFLT